MFETDPYFLFEMIKFSRSFGSYEGLKRSLKGKKTFTSVRKFLKGQCTEIVSHLASFQERSVKNVFHSRSWRHILLPSAHPPVGTGLRWVTVHDDPDLTVEDPHHGSRSRDSQKISFFRY